MWLTFFLAFFLSFFLSPHPNTINNGPTQKEKKMSTEMRGYVIEIIIGEKKKEKS